jgi:DNA polymerase III, delta subunit
MSKPTLSPSTKKQIDSIVASGSQATLIYGEDVHEAQDIALYVANEWGSTPQVVYPETAKGIDIENGQIKIEQVRSLYEATRTFARGKRVVILYRADTMTTQAQNAFLKLLEEPNASTFFILTASRREYVLPTILSRVQQVYIQPISESASRKYIDQFTLGETRKKQIVFLAQGLPHEMNRLATDDTYFEEQAALMHDARELLRSTTYQKLMIVHKYGSDRTSIDQLFDAMARIARRMVAVDAGSSLMEQLDRLIEAQQRLQQNGNPRLCLLRFVL